MESDRFNQLSRSEKQILFEALLFCLDSNSGIGFHRYDQGHPEYRNEKESKVPHGEGSGAGNALFQMLRELSLHLVDDNAVTAWRKHFIFTWDQFCARAVSASEKHRNTYVRLEGREST